MSTSNTSNPTPVASGTSSGAVPSQTSTNAPQSTNSSSKPSTPSGSTNSSTNANSGALKAGQQTKGDPSAQNPSAPSSSNPPTSTSIKQPPIEYHDVKIDGEVQRLTTEELKQYASMSKAAQKRFEDASKIRKQNEASIARMKENFIEAALEDPSIGLTEDKVRQMVEDWYTKKYIEPTKLTPEQQRLKEAEDKVKKYELEEKGRKDKELAQEEERMTTQMREDYIKDLTKAVDESGLPKSEWVIQRLAYWTKKNVLNEYNAPMSVLVKQVQKEQDQIIQSMVRNTDAAGAIKLLGEDFINKIRKYDLDRLTPKLANDEPSPLVPQAASVKPPKEEESDDSMNSVSKNLRKLMRTGAY